MNMPAAKIDGRKRKSNAQLDSGSEKTPKRDPCLTVSSNVGHILTLGQGDVGQLGLGEDYVEKKRAAIVSEVDGIKFAEVTCGGMHSLAVTDKGEVYSWGCNDDGALGRHTTGDDGEEYYPRKVPLPDGIIIVKVSAGDSHSAALTSKGEVYAWGAYRDASGQIGLTAASIGKKNEITKIYPKSDEADDPAVKVASGNDHTVILTADGNIYTSGTGEQGQLGRIKECFGHRGGRRGLEFILSPQIVRLRKRIRFSDIFCGSFSTFALCRDTNHVYAWGLNNYGQLGNGTTVNCFNPEIIKPLSELRTSEGSFLIQGGQHHTILIDSNGVTYAIGRAEYGRLGLGENAVETSLPTKIPTLSEMKVRHIACGEAVSFAITDKGHLYSWGIGTNLQLGIGDEEDFHEPNLVKSKNVNPETDEVISVSAGGQHTTLLVKKKEDLVNGT